MEADSSTDVQVTNSEEAARDAVAGDPEAELVIAFGRAFHQSGMPVDTTELLMHQIADAVGIELQVTALPTSITAALGTGILQRVVLLRLEPGSIDLRRLALLNKLFDRVTQGLLPTTIALAEVRRIADLPHEQPWPLTIAAYCLLSLGASIILGGGRTEFVVATTIGFAIGTISVLGRVVPLVDRLFEVLASFAATAIVALVNTRMIAMATYVPLIAGVTQLLPGLQLTTALHELAYRNLVAGTARLGAVVMTLLSLGCGFALAIAFTGAQSLFSSGFSHGLVPWYELVVAVAAISTAIALLSHARLLDFPWVVASCTIAEIAYRGLLALPGFQVATFGAALAVGLAAALASRHARVPQPVLLYPGLLVLVPGALGYEGVLFTLASDPNAGSVVALSSVIAAVEIVAGLLLAQLFFSPVRRQRNPVREMS